MKILNLTQHTATPEQVEAGVVEVFEKSKVKKLLTFDEKPSKSEMEDRAIRLARICIEEGVDKAMIGGAPYFMSILERVLKENGIQPLYAFSKRIVKEEMNGWEVLKTTKFVFEGFIEV